MKPYLAYKDSGIEWIGEIPEYWEVKKIKFITSNHDGKRIPLNSEERGLKKGKIPYYGANGIVDYIDDYLFNGEYILIGEDGAPFFELHKPVSFVTTGKFWVNNHAHILEVVSNYSSKFICHCLNQVDYKAYITGSTRDKLTQNELNKISIFVPTISEQTQIAAFLDHKTNQIDDLLAKKEKLIELLKEERTAIINQAVTKGLPAEARAKAGLDPHVSMKDSGIEWLGEIPEHWVVKPVKFVFENFDSVRVPISSEERGKMTDRKYDYYGASGIIDKVENYLFEGEYILIGEDGANLLTRSTELAFKATGKFWVNNHAHILKPLDGNIDFFTNLLERIDYTTYISGSAQPKLTQDRLGNVKVPVPPVSEQTQIIYFLDQKISTIVKSIFQISKEINLIKEYKTSLINEAVTGKIDVRDYKFEGNLKEIV